MTLHLTPQHKQFEVGFTPEEETYFWNIHYRSLWSNYTSFQYKNKENVREASAASSLETRV